MREAQMKKSDLFHDEESSRNLLSALLEDTLLYHQSVDFRALLDFTTRLRNVAPFNAMLLHIQKPGIQYVATRYDWLSRFGRTIKDGTRPLLILVPFGPVALVYDVDDTEGRDLPKTVFNPFPAKGDMTDLRIERFISLLAKKKIEVRLYAYGSGKAGDIQATSTYAGPEAGYHGKSDNASKSYVIHANSNHDPNVQFATIAHELAHLYLGHLGGDKELKIAVRSGLSHAQVELEAETTSYLICKRNGIDSESEIYLSEFMKHNEVVEGLDLYLVMKAAGQVEAVLELAGEKMHYGQH
jgi:hypothetical protein